MRYTVQLLRTPTEGFPVTRVALEVDAADMVEAVGRAIAAQDGNPDDWWGVSAVPFNNPQQPDKSNACDV